MLLTCIQCRKVTEIDNHLIPAPSQGQRIPYWGVQIREGSNDIVALFDTEECATIWLKDYKRRYGNSD